MTIMTTPITTHNEMIVALAAAKETLKAASAFLAQTILAEGRSVHDPARIAGSLSIRDLDAAVDLVDETIGNAL